MAVEFHSDGRGVSQVEEFIENLSDKKHIKKIVGHMDKLEKNGVEKLINSDMLGHLEGDVYYLRVCYGTCRYRLYFINFKNKFLMIYAYLKKTQKIPKNIVNKILDIRQSINT